MQARLFARQPLLLWAFVLPGVVYVLAWRIVPALYTAFLSLHTYNLAYDAGPRWYGLANYVRLAGDAGLMSSLRVTLVFAASAVTAELMLGLGAALLFDRNLPGRHLWLGIFLIPMVLPPVAVATVWYVLLNPFVGPVPHLIRALGGPEILWLSGPGTALLSLIVADIWEWTPFMTLLLLASLQAIPRELVEAAMVDGAAGLRIFRHITVPHITGMTAVAVGLRFMDAFIELDKVLIMTGGGPGAATTFVSVRVFKTAFQFFTLGYAAAIVMVLLLVLALLYSAYLRAVRRASRLGTGLTEETA
ncbi:MAG: sugar ABC transporter permease [Armatimonadota bacterium]|nr:sugar ABC transporter permease [Armatimonadota bacterium]